MTRRILVVLGTRPEAIKQAPVVWALRGRPDRFRVRVLSTGQHREMLRPLLPLLDLRPDIELNLMRPDQGLAGLSARCLEALDEAIVAERPDAILVQGDTTTAMAAALAGFYRRIPIGHVEAGLRSGSLVEPFPEEMNRHVADRIATWLFAPTARAGDLLRAEGHPSASIRVTGNTVVDALHHVRERLHREPPDLRGLLPPEVWVRPGRLVLVTCHRRESFGDGIAGIGRGLARLARQHADFTFVYPVHLNPNVRAPMHALLRGLPNLHLIPPIPYEAFLALMARSHLVLTDSGGVQEEAPSFGVPLLILRNRTERPEGVEAGCARLVGTDADRIYEEGSRLLRDPSAHAAMARVENPYGDGRAGIRIADTLEEALCAREVA